jgi:hypothetical protein
LTDSDLFSKCFGQSFCCFAEIYAKTLKIKRQELAEHQRAFIKEKSALMSLNEPIALESAKIQLKMEKDVEGWE